MGIGHDIRSKKVYRLSNDSLNAGVVHANSKDDSSDSSSSIVANQQHKELEDDFFQDEKDHRRKTDQHDFHGQRKSSLPKWLAVVFVLVLFGLLAYQNYDQVLKHFGILPKGETVTESSKNQAEIYTSSNSNQSSSTSDTASSETATPTAIPSTLPATIDKASITISVLNGNGISGSAQAVSQTLKTAGFNPTKAINARKFTYTSTYIYYQTGKEAEATLVANALTGRTIVQEPSDSIAGNYNLVVIVGKN